MKFYNTEQEMGILTYWVQEQNVFSDYMLATGSKVANIIVISKHISGNTYFIQLDVFTYMKSNQNEPILYYNFRTHSETKAEPKHQTQIEHVWNTFLTP